MPSKSPEQARLMAAVAHGWHPTGMKGPPVSVAKEFNQADKGSSMLRNAMRRKKAAGGGMSPGMLQMLLSQLGQQAAPNMAMGRPQGMRPQPVQMPNQQPTPHQFGWMGSPLGQLSSPQPGSIPMRQPQPVGPIGAPRAFAHGGGVMPPQMGIAPPQTPVSPLSTLMGQGMAAQHAGYPGPRKPRIPLPGQLRNINQTINRSRERLAGSGLR